MTLTIFLRLGTGNFEIHGLNPKAQGQTANAIYAAIPSGTTYIASQPLASVSNMDLGATADTDLQNQLSSNFFSVGLRRDSSWTDFWSSENGTAANNPQLTVTYTTTTNVTTPSGTQSGNITISYNLLAIESLTGQTITAQYSQDGGTTFATATAGTGGEGGPGGQDPKRPGWASRG